MQARLRSRKTVASSFATRPGCRGRTNYYQVADDNYRDRSASIIVAGRGAG